LELSAIRIFDGGIITLDPLIVDELGSQAAFTYATCSQDYHMEFATRLVMIMSWHDGGKKEEKSEKMRIRDEQTRIEGDE
jgi:hypothetical protein